MLIIVHPTNVSLFVVEQKFDGGLRGKVKPRYFVVLLDDSDMILRFHHSPLKIDEDSLI